MCCRLYVQERVGVFSAILLIRGHAFADVTRVANALSTVGTSLPLTILAHLYCLGAEIAGLSDQPNSEHAAMRHVLSCYRYFECATESATSKASCDKPCMLPLPELSTTGSSAVFQSGVCFTDSAEFDGSFCVLVFTHIIWLDSLSGA